MCLTWGSPCDEGRLKVTNDERAGNAHGCITARLVALLLKDDLFEETTVGARQNAFASLARRSVDPATLHLEINHSKADNDRSTNDSGSTQNGIPITDIGGICEGLNGYCRKLSSGTTSQTLSPESHFGFQNKGATKKGGCADQQADNNQAETWVCSENRTNEELKALDVQQSEVSKRMLSVKGDGGSLEGRPMR